MASFKVGLRDFTDDDDDVSAIIGEYSIPNLADITSDSLLTKSQYAKVIFHDLLPCYPTDADIWCRYSLTDGITSQHGDRVALYRVGWSSVHEHVQFEVAPIANNIHDKDFQVLFKAEALPKDTSEFYQLCYVNVNDSVCGASVPFQFRRPVEEELCEVEEQGGIMVVRSRTAINGEKLRDAAKMIEELESEKLVHEEKLKTLETAKDSLSHKLEELHDVQKRENHLRRDVRMLETEKCQTMASLEKAGERIQSLSETVASLSKDNSVLTELLKGESHQQAASQEITRFKLQIDNMQQMLDALTQSKEMASQALRCEQSKVMTLNIEHDKYKYRAQHLEDENKTLQTEMQRSKNQIQACEQRVHEVETLLRTKAFENEAMSSKLLQLIKQVGQMQFDVRQLMEHNDSLKLQLRQRDNQILALDTELKDSQTKGDSFEQLNEEYANLKRQLRECDAIHSAAESLTRENARLRTEVAALVACKAERDTLSFEFELLSVSHAALQNELYNSTVNSSFVHDLQENNASLRCRLQQTRTKEPTATSLEELKCQLSAAEASNTSLMHELKQIKDFVPSCSSLVADALGDEMRSSAYRPPVKNLLLKQTYQTLKEDKAKLELELQDVLNRENVFKSRSETITRRLSEIEEDATQAKSDLEATVAKNRRDRDDLVLINSRMASVQQQLLRDDQKEGRDFHDNSDQDRLERMSKRSHDLQCSFTAGGSRIYDLQQNIQVLDQERAGLIEEFSEKPWVEKRMAEEKCKILEKLVNLDQGLITLREELFTKTEADMMNRSCSDFARLENGTTPSLELRSTDLDASVGSVVEDAIIPEARMVRSEVEPIEQAVESGVREGLKCGMNALKQQVADSLPLESINSSTESLTSVERECALADQACQEKERLLEEKLTVVLKDTVRKELLEGMLGDGGATSDINVSLSGTNEVEADLKLRLEMAAEEYRKIYTQKLKLEKQLAKVQHKQGGSSRVRVAPVQGCTVEPTGYVCPICGVSFPPTHSDTFTRHFEDHLS